MLIQKTKMLNFARFFTQRVCVYSEKKIVSLGNF